jgi:hypothetical protein
VAKRKQRRVPDKVLRAIEAMAEDATDTVTINRVECGLHSGFPLCCIVFFVKLWGPVVMDTDDRWFYVSYHAMLAQLGVSAGYIPCPRCALERSIVEVRPCNCTKRRRAR